MKKCSKNLSGEEKKRIRIVSKIWGHEKIIVNKDYCGKKLVLKRGFRFSLHYHKKKDEVFYLIRGKILMEVGERKWIMKPEDSVHIEPNTLHRFTGLTDAQIIEFSSHHDDSDSYREESSGKARLKKAYDYDGVITAGIVPEKEAPIITSRTIDEIEKLDDDTKKNHPVYFNPISASNKTFEIVVQWKSEMIKRLGIEEYYENDAEIVVRLEKLCPNCYIINVGESKVRESE